MDQKQIDRLNELAKKAKSPEGLTQWDAVLGSLQGQLDHTYIVDEQGNKRKLKKKGE